MSFFIAIFCCPYDKNGRITKKILPNEYQKTAEKSNGYQYTYDKIGRIITIIAPDGKIIETNTYDESGRIIKKLDAKQSGVTYEYDLGSRIKTIKTIGGTKQEYQYDAQGNIIGIIDGNQNKTKYNLDKWGRITQITKADGSDETFTYDYAGNITETTDGEGNKIQYEYNLINKLKQITDQTGQSDHFNYDAQGRIKNHVDRNGNKITYNYNIYGSLTQKTEQNTGLSQIYEYHPGGTLKAAIANGMRYGYSYYPDGRLKQKTASGKTLLAYEYDLNGNKTKQTDVTGKTTQYSYNETDLLTEITDEQSKIVSFSYNEDGTRREVMSANGMKTVYDYDIDKNISGLNIEFNGQTLANNKYAYDGNGNRTQKHQLRGTTNYAYDNVNRLVKAQYPDYQEELFYDKTGNRTRRIVSGIEEQYQYDVRNRLISHTKQGAETKYQYDNAGNLLNDGENSYSYDGFNRTTKVETKDGKIQTNKYDAEGLRYEIEENNKLVQFIFNENKEVVVEQTEENLKRLIRSFDLWASECTQEKTWYHYASDEQGSTVFVADEEEIKNRYEYDAWGNATVCEEQVENRYKYTGQQFDPVTQQYYLRARYYNPIIARFTQEDEYRGDGLNLYAYCENNPVMYYDPSGYASECLKDAYTNQREQQKGREDYDSPEAKKEAYENAKKDVAAQKANQPDKPQADAPNEYPSTYKQRLDQTPKEGVKGEWTGERGESTYKSNDEVANQILKENGVDGIKYSNAIPDFSPVKKGEVKIDGMTNNRKENFKLADEELAKERGVTVKEIRAWREDNKLTWHECNDMSTMQAVPGKINGTFGHLGGVGEINKSNK